MFIIQCVIFSLSLYLSLFYFFLSLSNSCTKILIQQLISKETLKNAPLPILLCKHFSVIFEEEIFLFSLSLSLTLFHFRAFLLLSLHYLYLLGAFSLKTGCIMCVLNIYELGSQRGTLLSFPDKLSPGRNIST